MTNRTLCATLPLAGLWAFALPLAGQATCAAPWTLEQTFTLPGEAGALSVAALDLDRDGRIYLAHFPLPHVSVYSRTGRLERTIGRAGQGPGEFNFVVRDLGWRGDTLWVADVGRVHFFQRDGRSLGAVQFRTSLGYEHSAFQPWFPLADGTFLASRAFTNVGAEGPPFEVRATQQGTIPTRRFGRDGAIAGVIVHAPWGERYVRIDREDGSVTHRVHPLYTYLNTTNTHPDGVPTHDGASLLLVDGVRANAAGGTFDLLRIGLAGDTLLRRSVAYGPHPVTETQQTVLRDWFANWVGGDYNSPLVAPVRADVAERRRSEARAAFTLPPFHPPVRQVVAGHDGSIWLLRELRFDARGERLDRWEAYGTDGDFLGFLEVGEGTGSGFLPWAPRLGVLRATLDEIWGTTREPDGTLRVRRFAVRRSCEAH